jgi:hypothetical protein
MLLTKITVPLPCRHHYYKCHNERPDLSYLPRLQHHSPDPGNHPRHCPYFCHAMLSVSYKINNFKKSS